VLAIGVIGLFPAIAGTTGSVSGFLKDNAGMPVTGAKVTLLDIAKGTSIASKTDRNGSYGFPLVFPGTYKLHAEARGFASQDRPSVVVHVDSLLRIDLMLKPEKDSR
jgi:hypothetical protein